MSIAELKAHLKNGGDSLLPLYLLYGEEEYLIEHYSKELRNAVGDEDETVLRFPSEEDFIASAESFSMLGGRRAVTVKDFDLKSPIRKYITDNINDLPPQTVIILCCNGKCDTKEGKELLKAVSSSGLAVEFPVQSDTQLRPWIVKMAEKRGASCSLEMADYLLSCTDNSMRSLANEIEKLSAYSSVVTAEAIDNLCAKTLDSRIYELTNALLEGKGRDAYAVLRSLRSSGSDEYKIAAALFSSAATLLKIKAAAADGVSVADIARALGSRDFVIKRQLAALNGVSEKRLSRLVEYCCEADLAMKTSTADKEALISEIMTRFLALRTAAK